MEVDRKCCDLAKERLRKFYRFLLVQGLLAGMYLDAGVIVLLYMVHVVERTCPSIPMSPLGLKKVRGPGPRRAGRLGEFELWAQDLANRKQYSHVWVRNKGHNPSTVEADAKFAGLSSMYMFWIFI